MMKTAKIDYTKKNQLLRYLKFSSNFANLIRFSESVCQNLPEKLCGAKFSIKFAKGATLVCSAKSVCCVV